MHTFLVAYFLFVFFINLAPFFINLPCLLSSNTDVQVARMYVSRSTARLAPTLAFV